MPFSSHPFLFFMLAVLAGYAVVSHRAPHWSKAWLIAASLFFYGWWIPGYLLLFLASLSVNYSIGETLRKTGRSKAGTAIFIFGIAANLGLIGFYKYAALAVSAVNAAFGAEFPLPQILLPIGISFFTFQQVGYLIDIRRGTAPVTRLSDYVFFVAFFPQLIAGPIVTQSDFLPQLAARTDWRLKASWLMPGIALFSAGLFKKTVLSDLVAPYADKLFSVAASGAPFGAVDAWIAATCYSFQIYFDFSGYSDMAIGLGFMFGFRLPINFHSPYKAAGIRDFWRRWHITLSRFLRDYLYIPLGGSRHGLPATMAALIVTMTLGGLWHGAGVTFIIWGLLHGLALAAAHLLKSVTERLPAGPIWLKPLRHALLVAATFAFVTFTWVWFRSPDVATAWSLSRSMLGLGGASGFVSFDNGIYPYLPAFFVLVWALPNTNELFAHVGMALHAETWPPKRYPWLWRPLWFYRPGFVHAALAAGSFTISWFALSNMSPFIYFQF